MRMRNVIVKTLFVNVSPVGNSIMQVFGRAFLLSVTGAKPNAVSSVFTAVTAAANVPVAAISQPAVFRNQ